MERKKEMKTLWSEKFSPSQIEPFKPTLADFNQAWEWMFERDENKEFIRAGLCLIVIHNHSLKLRKQGIKESAQIAAIAIWRLYSTTRVKMPQRAF